MQVELNNYVCLQVKCDVVCRNLSSSMFDLGYPGQNAFQIDEDAFPLSHMQHLKLLPLPLPIRTSSNKTECLIFAPINIMIEGHSFNFQEFEKGGTGSSIYHNIDVTFSSLQMSKAKYMRNIS